MVWLLGRILATLKLRRSIRQPEEQLLAKSQWKSERTPSRRRAKSFWSYKKEIVWIREKTTEKHAKNFCRLEIAYASSKNSNRKRKSKRKPSSLVRETAQWEHTTNLSEPSEKMQEHLWMRFRIRRKSCASCSLSQSNGILQLASYSKMLVDAADLHGSRKTCEGPGSRISSLMHLEMHSKFLKTEEQIKKALCMQKRFFVQKWTPTGKSNRKRSR